MVTSKAKRPTTNDFAKGLLVGGIVALFLFFVVDANRMTETTTTLSDVAIVEDAIDFTMGTRLGTDQVEEHIEVFVEDELIGVLHITEENPIDTLELEVPVEGIYEYRINSVTRMVNENGTVQSFTGNGTGMMDIQEGDHFSAYYNPSTRIWTMMFIEE